ncbi:hypothetical protein ACFW04_012396 [Cataglyphis niger]
MDNVLSGLQGNELFVYMDDIVIYVRSLKEHEVKFNKLMERLRKANLKLQPDKCEFLRREVAYLGHIIGADGVKPDPNKIKSISKFPIPKNEKNIKQFLGLAGYYRRFIPQFSKTAKPLTDLLKKNNTFNWQQRQTEAFNILRNALYSESVLQYPNFTKPFVLTTDASGYAIGGVLSQGQIGKDLPIAYTPRVLNNNADALSRNPPTNYILPLFTANPVDESSNESTFSFERRPRRPTSDRQMSSSPIDFSPYNQQLEDNQSASKQTDITIEEYFNDDYEIDRTIANSDEDSNQYEEIIDLNDEPQNTDRIIIIECSNGITINFFQY